MDDSYDSWKTSNYKQTKLEKEEYEEIQQKYNECWSKINKLEEPEREYRNSLFSSFCILALSEKIRKKIKRMNMNGNKKNIGKRTEQKRRPGGAG